MKYILKRKVVQELAVRIKRGELPTGSDVSWLISELEKSWEMVEGLEQFIYQFKHGSRYRSDEEYEAIENAD